jgi:hypothetical protein
MFAQSQPVLEYDKISVLAALAHSLQCANGKKIFCMMSAYTLYCDAAGKKDQGFIVVAGYLSTLARWEAFTEEWKLFLSTYDLPYFHMKEFAQSKGPFSSWENDEPRRIRFMSKATGIIKDHVERLFASIVEFESFNRVNKIYCLDEFVGVPYSLCGRTCVARASNYLGDADANIDYIFEDGDEGKGELMRVLDKDGFPSPIFKPSRDQKKKGHLVRGVIPLQSADFAAYEIRKVFKDDPMECWPIHKYRKSLQALARIDSNIMDWGRYTENDLIVLCQKASIPLRGTVL